VRRVGVIAHPAREAAVRSAKDLLAWLAERGVDTRELEGAGLGAAHAAPPGAFAEGLDLVVSVGGDGTFLHAAHLASLAGCPVLGVKVGRMGFLTEVEPEEAPALVERVLAGTARVEERLAVRAEAEGTPWTGAEWALNEVIVEKGARHRLVRLALYVDGEYVTTFSADGVIVATPTGSTAYSFSAHGPIVVPTVPCLIVTPIAAHMVFDRSIVLGPDQRVTLEVTGEEPGLLSADGRESRELPVGAVLRIARAPTPARLVRRDGAPGFLSLVREKFGLPGEPGPRGP
jgi:NAD+ kinase